MGGNAAERLGFSEFRPHPPRLAVGSGGSRSGGGDEGSGEGTIFQKPAGEKPFFTENVFEILFGKPYKNQKS